jgi:hypothetical protein
MVLTRFPGIAPWPHKQIPAVKLPRMLTARMADSPDFAIWEIALPALPISRPESVNQAYGGANTALLSHKVEYFLPVVLRRWIASSVIQIQPIVIVTR